MVPVPAHLHAHLHNVAPCARIGITVQLAMTAKQQRESACAVVAWLGCWVWSMLELPSGLIVQLCGQLLRICVLLHGNNFELFQTVVKSSRYIRCTASCWLPSQQAGISLMTAAQELLKQWSALGAVMWQCCKWYGGCCCRCHCLCGAAVSWQLPWLTGVARGL